MSNTMGMQVAVIGGGISGIAAARMLQKNGFTPVIFEQAERSGGVWALAYPGVRLQNIDQQYHLSDFPWPFKPDFHPTGEQIMRYMDEAVKHFQLDLRTGRRVVALEERPDGWLVRSDGRDGPDEAFFSYVIVSSGQYSGAKHRPHFPGEELFEGEIITERDIRSLEQFDGKRVVAIGFGKSALDMTVMAAPRAVQVHHIFRTPRWTIPEYVLGIHATYILFSRFGSVMMTSWGHPSALARFLHGRMAPFIAQFWGMIGSLFRYQENRVAAGMDEAARERLRTVQPDHPILLDMRSAAALAPEEYYPLVAQGRILPSRAGLAGFSKQGVLLQDGREIACDLVVLSLGSEMPAFSFLPEKYRQFLESENDGAQLYRHLIHPRIPRLGFAGFNHGFMHIPSVEIGVLWLCAVLRGEMKLPRVEEMEQVIERIRAWKRAHIQFEPSRSCAVNTRYQQYMDILLQDLGISPYRKMPNVFAEVFSRYGAADYRDIYTEYERKQTGRRAALKPLPLDM